MLWRHLWLVRAASAAGLLSALFLVPAASAGEPDEPAPGDQVRVETVNILEAQGAGSLDVSVRGNGAERVKFAIKNNTTKRLNVVLPPGLVAAATTGQLQSMGLGAPNNQGGAFGSFRSVAPTEGAFRSVPPSPAAPAQNTVAVPPGQTIEFAMPSVCLNFGLPTPTHRDTFKLVDVNDYSTDARVRKALRSLATYGTSHGVAQAVMWRVCNDVPFPMMVSQFSKIVSPHETALASRFIEALDASSSTELVDPSYLTEGRMFVQIKTDSAHADQAKRLAEELGGQTLMGLPVRAVDSAAAPQASGPALFVVVNLSPGRAGETKGKIAVRYTNQAGHWAPLGTAVMLEGSAIEDLDGASLTHGLDRAIAASMIKIYPGSRTVGSTTLKIQNGLPFTLATVVVKTGDSAGAPSVSLPALGVGPGRLGSAPVQAPGGSIERVELNGL